MLWQDKIYKLLEGKSGGDSQSTGKRQDFSYGEFT